MRFAAFDVAVPYMGGGYLLLQMVESEADWESCYFFHCVLNLGCFKKPPHNPLIPGRRYPEYNLMKRCQIIPFTASIDSRRMVSRPCFIPCLVAVWKSKYMVS